MRAIHNQAIDTIREDRRAAADAIATDLFDFEAAIDEALACAGRLTATVPAARKQARVSATVGQAAFDRLAIATAALIAARASTVEMHHEFADVHKQLLKRSYASGDLWKLAEGKATSLTVVAAE